MKIFLAISISGMMILQACSAGDKDQVDLRVAHNTITENPAKQLKTLDEESRRFFQDIFSSNLMLVNLNQAALEHATSDRLKIYARVVARDREDLVKAIRQFSTEYDLGNLGLNHEDQATWNDLHKLRGGAFDRAYLRTMATTLDADLKEFKKATESEEPRVMQFAESVLLTINRHREAFDVLTNKKKD